MEFIKRLFKTNKKPSDSWTMFSTSKSEVKELLVSLGDATIGKNFITIENYPFQPYLVFEQNIFTAGQINDIDVKSSPPTLRVKDELIFVNKDLESELVDFAKRNRIKIVERPTIWEWILEPFLDTEFTTETDEQLMILLKNYGLTSDQVRSLRVEVETQMLKYNFDTMLWEWGGLGAVDVLRAMRIKYSKDKYKDFYERVMKIALLTTK